MVTGKLTGNELRRTRQFGLTGYGEAEREREEEDVREDRVLTLSTWRCSLEAEDS